ncbi:unnamed protein product, partial [Symbiodinium sp. CCMP2456]
RDAGCADGPDCAAVAVVGVQALHEIWACVRRKGLFTLVSRCCDSVFWQAAFSVANMQPVCAPLRFTLTDFVVRQVSAAFARDWCVACKGPDQPRLFELIQAPQGPARLEQLLRDPLGPPSPGRYPVPVFGAPLPVALEDEDLQVVDCLFAVLKVNYSDEQVVASLALPADPEHVLSQVQTLRGTLHAESFPLLIPANYQPSPEYVTLLALPSWADEMPVVVCDCSLYSGRVFSLTVSAVMRREDLLVVAGLGSGARVHVFANDGYWSLAPGQTVRLSTGDLFAIVPFGSQHETGASFPHMLLNPEEWNVHALAGRDEGLHLWVLSDLDAFHVSVDNDDGSNVRRDIAGCLDCPVQSVAILAATPRIDDHSELGIDSCLVLLATQHSCRRPSGLAFQFCVIFDLRPLYRGIEWSLHGSNCLCRQVLQERFLIGCPDGCQVLISGGRSRQEGHREYVEIVNGQVLVIQYVVSLSAEHPGEGPDDVDVPDSDSSGHPGFDGEVAFSGDDSDVDRMADDDTASERSRSRGASPDRREEGTGHGGRVLGRFVQPAPVPAGALEPESLRDSAAPVCTRSDWGGGGIPPSASFVPRWTYLLLGVAQLICPAASVQLPDLPLGRQPANVVGAADPGRVEMWTVGYVQHASRLGRPTPTPFLPGHKCSGSSDAGATGSRRPLPTPCRQRSRGRELRRYCAHGQLVTLLEGIRDADTSAFFFETIAVVEALTEHFEVGRHMAPAVDVVSEPVRLILEDALPASAQVAEGPELFDLDVGQCQLPCSVNMLGALTRPESFLSLHDPPEGAPAPERFRDWVLQGGVGTVPAADDILVLTTDGSYSPASGAAGWAVVVSAASASDLLLPGLFLGCCYGPLEELATSIGVSFGPADPYLAELAGLFWAAVLALRLPSLGGIVFRADNIAALHGAEGQAQVRDHPLGQAVSSSPCPHEVVVMLVPRYPWSCPLFFGYSPVERVSRAALRLAFAGEVVYVLAGHAPHRAHDADTRGRWWDETSRVCNHCCSQGDWLLLLDANCRVGSVESPFIGSHDADAEDDAGELLHSLLGQLQCWLPATFESNMFGPGGTLLQKCTRELQRSDYVALPVSWRQCEVVAWTEPEVSSGHMVMDHVATMVWTRRALSAGPPKKGGMRVDREALLEECNQEAVCNIIRAAPPVSWTTNVNDHAACLVRYLHDSLAAAFPWKARRMRQPFLTEATGHVHQALARLRKDLRNRLQGLRLARMRCAFLAWRSCECSFGSLFRGPWLRHLRAAIGFLVERIGFLGRDLKKRCRDDKRQYVSSLAESVDRAGPAHIHEAVKRLVRPKKFRRSGPAPLPQIRQKTGELCDSHDAIT